MIEAHESNVATGCRTSENPIRPFVWKHTHLSILTPIDYLPEQLQKMPTLWAFSACPPSRLCNIRGNGSVTGKSKKDSGQAGMTKLAWLSFPQAERVGNPSSEGLLQPSTEALPSRLIFD
jgi:hypothetical protein